LRGVDEIPRKLWRSTALLDLALPPPPRWMVDARCRDADVDVFFPTKGQSPSDAKRICEACPVVDPCLAYALSFTGYEDGGGVWGGMTRRERDALRRSEAA
jgi:WhiB family transcriptional regulator, redox-sensing transcriptional regulator